MVRCPLIFAVFVLQSQGIVSEYADLLNCFDLSQKKIIFLNTRVNKKVKAIFKLRGNRDREELAHCAVLTTPVEEFSHVQYSTLPSVEWQQRGRKHGPSFARSKNNVP